MPLVTTREMFKVAYEQGFAVGAFNMSSLEAVQAITEVAAEEKSPIILQACPVCRQLPRRCRTCSSSSRPRSRITTFP